MGGKSRFAKTGVATAAVLALMLSVAQANIFGAFIEAPSDEDFHNASPEKIELGRLLFYDKLLSGNRNISCGACHNHDQASADQLSLGIGEGGSGLGTDRSPRNGRDRVNRRVPRNAPALFNLGAREFRVMFHDGRVRENKSLRWNFKTPAEYYLPEGLESALAAQALFPIISPVEMAGDGGENDVAEAVTTHPPKGWPILLKRIKDTQGYHPLFEAAYPGLTAPDGVRLSHVANAIAAFIGAEWRAINSPFDRYLRGEDGALPAAAKRGMDLFYGKASCYDCHGGKFQTDHQFHAIAMPQIGPGKNVYFVGPSQDIGRQAVTHDVADAYKFRTPSLRNVAVTAPYGHDGAFATLEGVLRHHLDPISSIENYDHTQAVLPADAFLARDDWLALTDENEIAAIKAANELEPMALSDQEVSDLLAFLVALTDESSLKGRLGKPSAVPSGLPVD